MFKRLKRILMVFLACFGIFLGMGELRSYAGEVIAFGPQDARIEGSIKYSLIGRYVAHFDHFKGRIVLGDGARRIESVDLEIEAGSVRSNHPWCDRLARSRKLLNTALYPKIIFKSDRIIRDGNNYEVKGVLEMHGIKRKMSFPFHVERAVIKGRWNINRKDFNIIWNKYLDQGGVLVSDIFTVDWSIIGYIK